MTKPRRPCTKLVKAALADGTCGVGLAENRRQTIHHWLNAPDPSANHNAAASKRQPNTGNWFIGGPDFANWKTGSRQFLWIHGPPGCGKTTLSSAVIHDVMQHCNAGRSAAIAYFYFDFQSQEKQTCQNLLRSLITQFADHFATIHDALERLYSKCGTPPRQPDLGGLTRALKGIVQEIEHAYIIVDALDECTERERLLKLIEDMVEWKLDTVHILVTSRKEREIEDSLTSRVSHEVDIQEAVIAQDIELHVQERLRNDTRLKKWQANVHDEIKRTLTEGAHGMFRWVACQLDELRKCAKLSELRKALHSLPKTLDDTYERILLHIDELSKDDVFTVLQWLCFSQRPITLDEMIEVLAVTFHDSPKFDPDERYPEPRDILSRCSSLVSVSSGNVIRLAHFSVKEYLVSSRIQHGEARLYGVTANRAHTLIGQTCVAYLLQFKTIGCPNEDTISSYPLADYAARYWIGHACFEDDAMSGEMRWNYSSLWHTPQFITWARLYDVEAPQRFMKLRKQPHHIAHPLYYATMAGILDVVRARLDKGDDINMRWGTFSSAFQVASSNGHKRIVELLLQHGANVNMEGGVYGSPFQEASHGGHEVIVKLLLQHGANINATGKLFGSALQAASFGGQEGIVNLLLHHGADVNTTGGIDGSPLQAASFRGHEGLVKVLLQHGANVNATGEIYPSALQAALSKGYEGVVKLLLQYGADVNAKGKLYGTALQIASSRGHEGTIKLLLQYGADVNAIRGPYGSALESASSSGRDEIVKLLLLSGADVKAQGGNSALQGALRGGHEGVVKLLLQHGAVCMLRGHVQQPNTGSIIERPPGNCQAPSRAWRTCLCTMRVEHRHLFCSHI